MSVRAVIADSQDAGSVVAGVTPARQLQVAEGPVETGALLTLAAASASVNSNDQTNLNGRGIKVVVDITAISGTTPTLTITIKGKDPTSGKYFILLASAALSTVATTVLTVYPGLTASANVVASDVLPKTWRVEAVITGTTPAVTATIAAILQP